MACLVPPLAPMGIAAVRSATRPQGGSRGAASARGAAHGVIPAVHGRRVADCILLHAAVIL